MKELKKYYRQIASWLPCGGKLKKELMANITATVEAFIAENPAADFAALQAHFGTPQQIATAFVEEMDTAELLNALKVRRKFLKIVFICAASIVAVWAFVMFVLLIDGLSNEFGHYVTTVTTVN